MKTKIALQLANGLQKAYEATMGKRRRYSEGDAIILANQCTIMSALRCIVIDMGNLEVVGEEE